MSKNVFHRLLTFCFNSFLYNTFLHLIGCDIRAWGQNQVPKKKIFEGKALIRTGPLPSVRPKPGFDIVNRNQGPISVSVSKPKLFLPKLPGSDWRTRSSCYCENLSTRKQRLSSHTTHCRIFQ